MPEDSSVTGDDLAAHLTERVEKFVDFIRDRSLRPMLTVVGYVFAGLAGLIIAVAVLVAVIVSITHLFNRNVFDGKVWATDFLIGGIFCLVGLFLLRFSAGARSGSTGE